MVMLQETEKLFNELLNEEKVQFFPSNGFFELVINLKTDLKIRIYYEYLDELYYVMLNYVNGDAYCLSAYDFYKDYIKKNIKRRLFKKTTLYQHIVLLKQYLQNNAKIIEMEKDFLDYISHSNATYRNIFL